MSDRTRVPDSLDDLLSANRDRLDEMFSNQMSGGTMERSTPVGNLVERSSASDAPPEEGADNVVAELNRKFGLGWSSRTVGESDDGEHVTTEVELNVGGRSVVKSASSRIGAGGREAALQRAIAKALKSAAEGLKSRSVAVGGTEQRWDTGRVAGGTADLITMNRIETALAGIRREVECAIARTALSPAMAIPGACSVSLMDASGQMISGDGGSFLAHVLEAQRLHLDPGDVLLFSDPFGSGGASSSVNVWLLVRPVFHGPDRIGYVSIQSNLSDVGGAAEGSTPANAMSVFAEGFRIPPVKIHAAGVLNESVLSMILTNSRTPLANRADLMALIGACRAGAAQLDRLCTRIGPEMYHQGCTKLLSRTNAAIRDLIRSAVPEEPQSFEDQIDDDGCGNGPFKLRLTVWREGDHAYFDWTGSSAQAPGPVNFYLHVGFAKAVVGQVLTRMLGSGLARNDGYYDLIHVTLPEGSVLKPGFPAAVGRHGPTMARHREILGAAIHRQEAAQISGAGSGSGPTFSFAGDGFRLVDRLPQGGGARPDRDAADSTDDHMTLEALEADYPVVIESLRALPDTGGAGRFRGGAGTEKVYRLLAAGQISIFDDRHASRNWGANGGRPGERSDKWIERVDGGREKLPAKVEGLAVLPGDVVVFRTSGGGGCGDPLTRDPVDVLRDVAGGFLAADAAARDYGVVIDVAGRQIERRATETMRAGLMRERQHPKLFDRGDPA